MFQDDPYHAYLDNNIASENPVSLVTALYEGAIKAVQQARRCLETEDIWGRSKAISKAVDIITELMRSLNHEKGGDLSIRLRDLYGYMQTRLLAAHANQEDEPMAEVIGLLTTLLDGWYKAGEQLAREAREQAQSTEPASGNRSEAPETPYGYGLAPAAEESTVFTV
jgi:flagellar protein FliS